MTTQLRKTKQTSRPSSEEVAERVETVPPAEFSDSDIDDIDELISEVERSSDDLLLESVRAEKVQTVRRHRFAETGVRAWTISGNVD